MRRFLPFIALVSILLAACERPVDIDLDNLNSKLAVTSNFVPNEVVEVYVSKTRSILNNNDPEYINNASVALYRGDKFLEALQLQGGDDRFPPRYITQNVKPVVNTLYTIKVEAPGFASVQAVSEIPSPAKIRFLNISEVRKFDLPDQKVYSYKVGLVFEDPANVVNFYHLNFYQQIWNYEIEEGDTVITGNWLRNIEFSSENDNNSLIAYFDGGVLFDDTAFDGKIVPFSFTLTTFIEPDKHILGKMFTELRTVSKDYYLFHNSLSRQQTSPGGPLSEPVIIYNNVENGRGIFAGYNPVVDSVAIFK